MIKSICLTLLLILTLTFIVPQPIGAQVTYGNKIVSNSSGCITPSSLTVGGSSQATATTNGNPCIVNVPSPFTSGIVTIDSLSTANSTTAVNINTSSGNIFGLLVDAGNNTNGSDIWINFFNAASANVTPGTTTPLMSVKLQDTAGSFREVIKPISSISVPYSTALSWNCTTTRNGTVALAAACHVVEFHK